MCHLDFVGPVVIILCWGLMNKPIVKESGNWLKKLPKADFYHIMSWGEKKVSYWQISDNVHKVY